MQNLLSRIVNAFNRVEPTALILWVLFIILEKSFDMSLGPILNVVSSTLAALYILQARVGMNQLRDKAFLIKAYPYVLGNSSAIIILGVFFKVMSYPGADLMAKVGIIGILISCVFLFYRPVQDEFLPVMKKILLRLFLLIAVGFLVSF